MLINQDPALPTLRNDIQLNEAPAEPEGSPSWTLYDPTANNYYKIGWLEFECLSRFNQCKTVSQLITLIKKETALRPDGEAINALIEFLITHSLVYATGEEAQNFFALQHENAKQPWWKKLMHSYLFFTIPLFKPERFLKVTYPIIKPLFTKPFIILVFLLLVYGIFLSIQRFDDIANTFMNYLTLEGVILFLGATIIVKIIHELGHAYTATKYGVPVTIIGVAFIVLYPILYTETTNAWKLKIRRERLIIAASGMMAELALSSIALLLWHILPPGMAQSLCFMVAIVSMLASLLVNLNPLMKFDGYYLFSDFVGIDNLQDRAFAFSKWQLRKSLWGWKTPRPEITDYKKQKLLTGFGFAVWIYRFFLYLGISILVYHLFFQPLGLIFMIIELAFFIGLPIIREVKIWLKNTREILGPLRGKISLFILISLLLLAFLPLEKRIEIPATLHTNDYVRLYPSIPSKIEEINVVEGQIVEKGEILFRLSSYSLNHNIDLTRQRLRDLKLIRDSSQATQELANKRSMINNEIENTEQELKGLKTISDKLTVKAPFAGKIKMMDPNLDLGQWVNSRKMLALLADDDITILSGYIREIDMNKLSKMNKGVFYAEYSPFHKFDVILNTVEKTIADTLFWPELSSIQGGAIPSEKGVNGEIKTLPQYSVYPIEFKLGKDYQNAPLPNFVVRGTIIMSGDRQILANTLFKKAVSIFRLDSGF